MAELAILVPVLARPHRIQPLLRSIGRATPDAHVLFLADPGDEAECSEIRRWRRRSSLRVDALACGGSYAAKIAAGVEHTAEPYLFLAADDLDFKPGWFEVASACLEGNIEVVGVNDLLARSREHATHFLMTRAYAERATIDGEPGPFFQGYSHWAVDNELIATAQHRGAYAYCPEAHVEHLHPAGGKAPDDATYERGRANRYADMMLFRRRQRLWRG